MHLVTLMACLSGASIAQHAPVSVTVLRFARLHPLGRSHVHIPMCGWCELCCRYEVLTLKVIHRRRRTGFEETKDFPIRVSDLIAGRYQARLHSWLPHAGIPG